MTMSSDEIATLLREARRSLEARAVVYRMAEDEHGVATPGMWCELCNKQVSAITDLCHDDTCLLSRLSEAALFVRLGGVEAA